MASDDDLFLPLDAQTLKEEVKFLRKLAKKTNDYRSKYDKEVKKTRLTKKSIEEHLSLREKPYYSKYYAFGKPIIKQKEREQLELIETIPKPLFNVISIEDVLEYTNTRENKLNTKLVDKVQQIIPPPTKPKTDFNFYNYYDDFKLEHPEIPKDEMYKAWDIHIKAYNEYVLQHPQVKQVYDNYLDEFEQWENQYIDKVIDVKANLYTDNRCIVEPHDTFESIKQADCNYGKILESFIYELQDKVKQQIKKSEWNKKFLGGKTIGLYHDTIQTMVNTNDIKKEIQRGYLSNYLDSVEYAKDHIDELRKQSEQLEQQKYNISRSNGYYSREYESISRQFEFAYQKYQKFNNLLKQFVHPETKEVLRNKIERQSLLDTENTIETFVQKNTEKMATILHDRQDCDQFIPKLSFRQGIIEGDIQVKCQNGDEFRVNNQLVFVPEGEKIAHYRFPTTFHDVKLQQKVEKMVSEEWMNKLFTKK